jgi:uncharacterized membrane protein YphA (DoxX/SURF4 family)
MDPLEVLIMNIIQSESLILIAQLTVSLSVLKVWLINFRQPSMWRGGGSMSMREEFAVYGLPDWMLYTVGTLKVTFSIGLIAGIWIPEVIRFSALGVAFFMFLAIIMHIKVNDPLYKSIPAGIFLALTVLIALFVEN